MASKTSQKILFALEIILFCNVLILFLLGLIGTGVGLISLSAWIVVFFLSILALTAHISQGSDEWYQYGILFATGILIALVLGIALGFDIYGITLLVPFAVVGSWLINWMFTDSSEEAIEQDLKDLEKEIA